MRAPFHPDLNDISITTVLHALSEPVRLQIIRSLADQPDQTCSEIETSVAPSTMSYHFKVLREAGLIRVCREGKRRFMSLRRNELEERFPGVLDAILRAENRESTSSADA